MSPIVELTREVVVRSLHRLSSPNLSEEENAALYGKCARLHGHDYRVRVTLRAPVDDKTGLAFDRDRLDKILLASIIEPLDGADLNDLFANTAGEALARALYLRLKPLFPDGVLARVGIQETAKNYFEFPPAEPYS